MEHASFSRTGRARKVTGRISLVSTAVDPRTRTLEVRADLANPRRPAAGLMASVPAALSWRREPNAVVVPDEAVQWDGGCHVVFVYDKRSSEGPFMVYHVRSVRPGVRYNGKTEIIAGVLPGEMVATTGSGVLRAELLKATSERAEAAAIKSPCAIAIGAK